MVGIDATISFFGSGGQREVSPFGLQFSLPAELFLRGCQG
jgi:hypothetical protein